MLHRSSAPQTWTDSAVGASKADRGEMLFISIYDRSVSSSIKLVLFGKKEYANRFEPFTTLRFFSSTRNRFVGQGRRRPRKKNIHQQWSQWLANSAFMLYTIVVNLSKHS